MADEWAREASLTRLSLGYSRRHGEGPSTILMLAVGGDIDDNMQLTLSYMVPDQPSETAHTSVRVIARVGNRE